MIVSPSRTTASGPPRAASGRDVPDHQPARRAREAAVGDERDRVAEARADDRRGDAQHLAHPRPAGRALVAHDEHVARRDLPGADGVGAGLLAVEHARRPALGAARPGEPSRGSRRARGCRAGRRARRRLVRRLDAEEHLAVGRAARPRVASASVRPSPSARRRRRSPPRDQLADERRGAARAVERLGRCGGPTGTRLASTGVRAPTSASSSSVSGTSASRAIASRCRIPFVEPPVAAIPASALRSARRSRNVRAVGPPAREVDRESRRRAPPPRASPRRSSAGTSPSPSARDARGSRARPPSCSP